MTTDRSAPAHRGDAPRGRPKHQDMRDDVRIRPMNELDIDGIVRLDERITGKYRPELWEQRVVYYLRRDPEASQVAASGDRVLGFMMGEIRGGEFGLDEATGWIEFFGVDPDARGKDLGRTLCDAILAHFRARGAHVTRTMVAETDAGVRGFLEAVGFGPAPIAALERRSLVNDEPERMPSAHDATGR